MDFIAAARRALVYAGIVSPFTFDTVKDAETENLVVERQREMGKLNEQNKKFYAKSADMEHQVNLEKYDLENRMDHLKRVTSATVDARAILEGIIARRHQRARRFSHD